MRERRSPAVQSRWTWVLLAAAGTVAASLSGCGNEDVNSVAIRQASFDLEALSPLSSPAASDEYVAQECQKIIQGLRSVTSDGNPSQKAAASELIARAQLGVSYPKSQMAHEIQLKTQSEMEVARSLYERLLVHRALETAANSYKPGQEQNDIEAEMAAVADKVAEAQAAKAQVDAAVSSLRASAAAKRSESQTFRNQEATLRQQVLTTEDYDEAARLMVKTQEARRSADALDVAASDLEAQANQQAPESEEAARQIQRYQNQASLLVQSRQDVTNRAQKALEDAATAAAAVADVHNQLTAALSSLATIYETEMLPAVDDAVSSLGQASSSASQARSVIQVARKIQGEAQQAIGDLQWSTAELSQSYGAFLQMVSETSPPLSGLGDLGTAIVGAKKAETDRLRLAAEALNSAADAISDQDLSNSIRERANGFSARVGDPVESPDDFGDPSEFDPAGEEDVGGQAG